MYVCVCDNLLVVDMDGIQLVHNLDRENDIFIVTNLVQT